MRFATILFAVLACAVFVDSAAAQSWECFVAPSYYPSKLKKGDNVTMTAKARGGSEPYRYHWQVPGADGVVSTPTTESVTISNLGLQQYAFIVDVYDSEGRSCRATYSFKIGGSSTPTTKTGTTTTTTTTKPPPPPKGPSVPLTVSIGTTGNSMKVGEKMPLEGLAAGGRGPYSYAWQMGFAGAGEKVYPSIKQTVPLVPKKTGVVKVSLTVTDATGAKATSRTTVNVVGASAGTATAGSGLLIKVVLTCGTNEIGFATPVDGGTVTLGKQTLVTERGVARSKPIAPGSTSVSVAGGRIQSVKLSANADGVVKDFANVKNPFSVNFRPVSQGTAASHYTLAIRLVSCP